MKTNIVKNDQINTVSYLRKLLSTTHYKKTTSVATISNQAVEKVLKFDHLHQWQQQSRY
jgi:hypothetical protein